MLASSGRKSNSTVNRDGDGDGGCPGEGASLGASLWANCLGVSRQPAGHVVSLFTGVMGACERETSTS